MCPPARCQAKLFAPCLRVSTAAKRAAPAPVPRAKTEEQTGCCLKAQWLSTCKKHCAVVGWSPDLCGLNQALPCTPVSPKKAYLINPVFYQLCCWWILRIVTSQGTQESSLLCPDSHTGTAAPAHSGSCSRPCAVVANPATTQHFLSPVSHSLFSPPHLGATKASLAGTSVCDSAVGSAMASESVLQQDQHL